MPRLPAPAPPPAAPPATLKPWAKAAISVLVTLHVAAVFVAPLALPPSSELAQRLYMVFRPYLEAAYLDHGYAFFAPDPGPSHLVRYELEFADGRTAGGVFPNLATERPRLLYHRHFMLSEFINSAGPEAPYFEPYLRSYAAHLLSENQAQRVNLFLRRHLLPTPEQVQQGMQLDDPRLYEERPLGSFDMALATAPFQRPEPSEDVPLGVPVREPAGLMPGQPLEPGL